LGNCYYEGKGAPQDYKQAAQWFAKAAGQGHGRAEYQLGAMYVAGQSVKQDFAQALQWFRQAANQGDDDAQCALGQMHHKGQGVGQDLLEAYRWYWLSSLKGNTQATEAKIALLREMTPEQKKEARQRRSNEPPGNKAPGTARRIDGPKR
jgi:TPR repeat protein